MKRFGLLRAIPMSFYAADLYRDVGRHWKGTGFLYLMLLLAICWIPSAARTHLGLRRFAATDVPKMTADLPDISISDGVMSSRPPGRHELRDGDRQGRQETVFIVDDSIDEVPSNLPPDTIMLTRHELGMNRSNRAERRVFKLSAFGDRQFTRQGVRAFLSGLQFWVPPVAYLLGLLGSGIFRVVQACVYGAVAQWLARRKSVTLDFRTALRIATVAVTPVIVLRTLMWFLPSEPAWYIRWPIAVIITVVYLRFAIDAIAADPANAPMPVVT
jgi:hypothetical protein